VTGDNHSGSEEVELDTKLARLEREEHEVSLLRRKLHERLASFPNSSTEERERELSSRRRELHAEIDALRARRSALRLERAESNES
jgi:hypothetical protein